MPKPLYVTTKFVAMNDAGEFASKFNDDTLFGSQGAATKAMNIHLDELKGWANRTNDNIEFVAMTDPDVAAEVRSSFKKNRADAKKSLKLNWSVRPVNVTVELS
jgi:hypothetical protein